MSGSRIRPRFTQAYGRKPLQIGAAQVALRSSGTATVPGSDRDLTFNGKFSIALAPGAVVLSDPVNLDVAPRSDLAVSIYLPEATGWSTLHFLTRQINYVSPSGNYRAAASMPVVSTRVCPERSTPGAATAGCLKAAVTMARCSPPSASPDAPPRTDAGPASRAAFV